MTWNIVRCLSAAAELFLCDLVVFPHLTKLKLNYSSRRSYVVVTGLSDERQSI